MQSVFTTRCRWLPGGTLTLNQNGTGETAFYGDNGVSTAYDTDINVNTTVNGGTFTVADGVKYGRTTFGTFDLKSGATLERGKFRDAEGGDVESQQWNLSGCGRRHC